ncbi:MAG: ABC transporter permease [Deltaproteobacteria bacterium]|nr:ABC transporter permease [Deltaproteobacteria bacterium]
MNLLVGSLTIGLILSLLAIGVYISFRIFNFADITADGSITLGASVAAVLLVAGINPFLATLAGAGAGFLAGLVTGILHARFKIHALLSGILVMTALYSINLRIMGKSNVSLMTVPNLTQLAERAGGLCFGTNITFDLWGFSLASRDASLLLAAFAVIVLLAGLCYLFFRTDLGTVMRATGDNAQMVRALGSDTGLMIILGLGISNGLVALSGALLAQYLGFADVQMGIGMVVWGLASVIIGESLVRSNRLGMAICGAVMGAILFRLLVAIALRFGLNPNDLKLVTALFVFFALVLPNLLTSWAERRGRRAHA